MIVQKLCCAIHDEYCRNTQCTTLYDDVSVLVHLKKIILPCICRDQFS